MTMVAGVGWGCKGRTSPSPRLFRADGGPGHTNCGHVVAMRALGPVATHTGVVSAPTDRERIEGRVRALLRKAESTPFGPEAEALIAKAQDLLTRYAIDEALLTGGSQHHGDATGGAAPVVRRIVVSGPYARGRAGLLGAVGSANRCAVVWDAQASAAMAVGFDTDLDATELVWRSLVAQAELAVAAAGPTVDHRGRSRTRSWRSAFWASFSQRIGQRLTEQNRATIADVANHTADASAAMVPMLASRQRQVDDAVARNFPRLATSRTRVSNGEGWSAGHRAADRARLGADRPVAGSAVREVGTGNSGVS